MPPPDGVTPYPNYYQAKFTVTSSGTVVGFDILAQGYGEPTQADVTIVKIPWSSPPKVVVQQSGIQPRQRTYRAIFYTRVDWETFWQQINQIGGLVTPRQPSAVSAVLNSASLSKNDQTTPDGLQTADLTFTVIAETA